MKTIDALKQAQPYIRSYKDKIFVIKLGGGILADNEIIASISDQIGLLVDVGVKVIIVHGGGPQASEMSKSLGIEPQMIAGRRVTDEKVLDIALMTYAGKINTSFVSVLNQNGVKAVGLTGADSTSILADKREPVDITDDEGVTKKVDFGLVGDIVKIDSELITTLLDQGFTPTLASICAGGPKGVLNVNADSIAQSLAIDLGAEKLIFITEVDGLLKDVNDPGSLIPFADNNYLHQLLKAGVISRGMRPKIDACSKAVLKGVKRTHIINGLAPNTLLTELFTGEGCGTMIVNEREKKKYAAEELA